MSTPPARPRDDRHEWMYAALPELALLPDEAARQAAIRSVRRRVFAQNVYFLLYAGALTLVAMFSSRRLLAALAPLIAWLNLPNWAGIALLALLLAGACVFGAAVLFNGSAKRALRRELVARGVAVCLRCGYDCRGQREPRCPECSAPFDPKLLTAPGDLP